MATQCPISNEQFLEADARMTITIRVNDCEQTYELEPVERDKTGSVGYSISVRNDDAFAFCGEQCPAMIGFNFTLIGTKAKARNR